MFNLFLGRDPVHDAVDRKAAKAVGALGLLKQIWGMCQIPTFALIIIQVALKMGAPHVLYTLVAAVHLPRAIVAGSTHIHWYLIILHTQGIVGSVPWTALVFLTLYLQLLGMTDFAASVLMAVFLGATGKPPDASGTCGRL